MRVLITGNMGYVGPVLTRFLKNNDPAIELIGFDSGFFGHSLTGAPALPESLLHAQHFGDVRDFPQALLEGVDAVVHLAAVSNDPMGNEFQEVTAGINQGASVRLGRLAAAAGVKHFVFASSCSMYGASSSTPRRESDSTNPLSAYALSKIGTEDSFREAELGDMVFTSLRFATACGMSDRLRLDLVLNDFVACAITTGEISVLSDGSPWRPLIDVEDMARAVRWAMSRDRSSGGQWLAVNVGRSESNYQIRDLASAVAKHVPGTRILINNDALPDRRSYQVDFSLFQLLAGDHLLQVPLDESIARLLAGFSRMEFSDGNFRNSSYMRLNTLRCHIAEGRLGRDLRWVNCNH